MKRFVFVLVLLALSTPSIAQCVTGEGNIFNATAIDPASTSRLTAWSNGVCYGASPDTELRYASVWADDPITPIKDGITPFDSFRVISDSGVVYEEEVMAVDGVYILRVDTTMTILLDSLSTAIVDLNTLYSSAIDRGDSLAAVINSFPDVTALQAQLDMALVDRASLIADRSVAMDRIRQILNSISNR